MSLNDFDNAVDPDDRIISKIGSAVQAAMAAKEVLNDALAEAIDSSSTFGYELGAEDMKLKIIDAFEAESTDCVGWALGVINAALSRN
jgi:hypothetical protein